MKSQQGLCVFIFGVLLLSLSCPVGLTTRARAERTSITLTYAFFAPGRTFPGKQMEHWASELEARTGGQVEVQTFPGGTLLPAREMYDGVLRGVADIGLGGLSFTAARPPAELGERLRLSIHIPGMLTFSGTARIRRIACAREGGVTVGVVFEDIDTTAYAALKRICERGGKPPAVSPSADAEACLAGQPAL